MEITEIELLRAALRGYRADREKLDAIIREIEGRLLNLGVLPDADTPGDAALNKKQSLWDEQKRKEAAKHMKEVWYQRYTSVSCPNCKAKIGEPCAALEPQEVHQERKAKYRERKPKP